ncbi:hypothetical protein PMALA_062260 [Plasmodium malariae]|uniref:Uncharacterized protein n=1 Tax=Plasmodium malariae TaxID=5858 RepID=A0A1A8X0G4_PLAMA|nr:hypothetical protein PMALA_062260 [Plasmodium malariae]
MEETLSEGYVSFKDNTKQCNTSVKFFEWILNYPLFNDNKNDNKKDNKKDNKNDNKKDNKKDNKNDNKKDNNEVVNKYINVDTLYSSHHFYFLPFEEIKNRNLSSRFSILCLNDRESFCAKPPHILVKRKSERKKEAIVRIKEPNELTTNLIKEQIRKDGKKKKIK